MNLQDVTFIILKALLHGSFYVTLTVLISLITFLVDGATGINLLTWNRRRSVQLKILRNGLVIAAISTAILITRFLIK